jgi:hypothetical protein
MPKDVREEPEGREAGDLHARPEQDRLKSDPEVACQVELGKEFMEEYRDAFEALAGE